MAETITTLFFVLFVGVVIWFIRKLYNAATEMHKEATEGIRDVRKRGKEWCDRVESTMSDPQKREELRREAGRFLAETLAEGISAGIREAHREITARRETHDNTGKETPGLDRSGRTR